MDSSAAVVDPWDDQMSDDELAELLARAIAENEDYGPSDEELERDYRRSQ